MDIATPFATPIPTGPSSTGSDGLDWTTVLGVLGVVLSLVLLWTGIRKSELSSPAKALVSFLDLALLVAGIISLGWLVGGLVVVAVNLLAILAHSTYLYIQYDDILTDAAVQGGASREEAHTLCKRLNASGGAFKALGPIRTAHLINFLSQRARSVTEIEQMAPALAALWVIFRSDLEVLVEKFDRLLRLTGKPASEAMRVADVLTAGTQKAAATFDEMIDGMLAVYDPTPD
jgi:hypothetical protein